MAKLEKFGLRPYRKLDGTPLVGVKTDIDSSGDYCYFPRRFSKTINNWFCNRLLKYIYYGCFNRCFYKIQQREAYIQKQLSWLNRASDITVS